MNTGSDTFESSGGATIFEQWWHPVSEARGVVAICHGYAEHSGRYAEAASHLVEHGYAVETLDLRGHGRSSGERVAVQSYDDYHDDLGTFLARVRERNPGKAAFLLGHSMGGGVVVSYLVMRSQDLDGVLLSGAAMLAPRTAPDPNAPPRPRAPLPSNTISRDPAVVAAYDSDPLVYRGAPNPNSFAASRPAYERVQAEMEHIAVPLLIMHGTDDLLVPHHGSKILMQRASSKDKTLKLYPGFYHEILNEPERLQVLSDVVAWLDART